MPSKLHLNLAFSLQGLTTLFVFLWWGERVGTLFVAGSVWLLMSVRAYTKGRVTLSEALQGCAVQLLGTALSLYWWNWQLAVVWFVAVSWVSLLVRAFTLAEFV